VLGDGGPITCPANARGVIGTDGTVNAKRAAGPPTTPVGRLKLVTPEGQRCSAAPTACSAPPTGELPADATARLQTARWRAPT
jgi:hypothetical protein